MKKLLLFGLILSAYTLTADEIPVTIYADNNGRVTIQYELTAKDPNNTMPIFDVKMTGEVDGKKAFSLKRITGSGTSGLIIGAGKQETYWDAAKDRPRDNPEHIKITVDVQDVSEQAKYLCVNLKKYTISYHSDPPDTSKNKCKTSELWLKRVEPGSFLMGSPVDELGRSDSETQHKVSLTQAYYLSLFETTQKQFQALTRKNPSLIKGANRPVNNVSYSAIRGNYYGLDWPNSHNVDETTIIGYKKKWYVEDGERDYEKIPIYASTFFGALRRKTGGNILFDLPTEAQWEYACRADRESSWNNGEVITNMVSDGNLSKIGWFRYNSFDKKKKDKIVHPVGEKAPNDWGFYDMQGNVSEWCLDRYAAFNAKTKIDPLGPSAGQKFVTRGGNYYDDASDCRSASRHGEYLDNFDDEGDNFDDEGDNFDDEGDIFYGCGFRVALMTQEYDYAVKKIFEYDIRVSSSKSLPVFKLKFYGRLEDGTEYPLDDIGVVYGDVAVGEGQHQMTWAPIASCTNLVDKIGLRVECEEITDEANYLVLDLNSSDIRPSMKGPMEDPSILADDLCRTDELWLRRIEPGTFTMGSPEDEEGRYNDETQHEVSLTQPFYIGVFEITQSQYTHIQERNPSNYGGDTSPLENVSYDIVRGNNAGAGWPGSASVDDDSFIGIVRSRYNLNFDLPTEAQWEYACRAGTTTALNNGSNLTNSYSDGNMAKLGRYDHDRYDYKGDYYYYYHTKVGSYLPNAWGLYDMHGNVSEICRDWYGAYGSNISDPKGSSNGNYRCVRGGDYYDDAERCRSAKRSYIPSSSAYSYIGFRIILAP